MFYSIPCCIYILFVFLYFFGNNLDEFACISRRDHIFKMLYILYIYTNLKNQVPAISY